MPKPSFVRSRHGLAAIGIAALLATACVHAQSKSGNREAFYRCKDGSGQTHYGDSLSAAARIQREAAETKIRQERAAREQHDRMLIETYLTVADIERLRDQRVELLASQYRVTEQNIKNLHERQARVQQQIARFKPYNDKPNAPPLPDHLAEELVNIVNGERVYRESLAKNKREQAQVKASFAEDIKRFKELKGIR